MRRQEKPSVPEYGMNYVFANLRIFAVFRDLKWQFS